jgi:hypothetical protein
MTMRQIIDNNQQNMPAALWNEICLVVFLAGMVNGAIIFARDFLAQPDLINNTQQLVEAICSVKDCLMRMYNLIDNIEIITNWMRDRISFVLSVAELESIHACAYESMDLLEETRRELRNVANNSTDLIEKIMDTHSYSIADLTEAVRQLRSIPDDAGFSFLNAAAQLQEYIDKCYYYSGHRLGTNSEKLELILETVMENLHGIIDEEIPAQIRVIFEQIISPW